MKKALQTKRVLAEIAIIAATHPEGFTYNIQEGMLQSTGYTVAVAETQDSHGADVFLYAVEYAIKNDIQCVGGWFDSRSGLFYFDATVIVNNKKEAVALAKENKQIAIFNLNSNREIRLKK